MRLRKAAVTIASVVVPNFSDDFACFYNCGRIIRDDQGSVVDIVELKDTTEDQKNIRELNVSYYCFDADWLWKNIDQLKNTNASKEYYLTDMIKIARQQERKVGSYIIEDPAEGMGVNTPEQLELVKKFLK